MYGLLIIPNRQHSVVNAESWMRLIVMTLISRAGIVIPLVGPLRSSCPKQQYDFGIIQIPSPLVWNRSRTGRNDKSPTVSGIWDIPYRNYDFVASERVNNGPTYGSYRLLRHMLLNDRVEAVEDLIVHTKNGGMGFRITTHYPHPILMAVHGLRICCYIIVLFVKIKPEIGTRTSSYIYPIAMILFDLSLFHVSVVMLIPALKPHGANPFGKVS